MVKVADRGNRLFHKRETWRLGARVKLNMRAGTFQTGWDAQQARSGPAFIVPTPENIARFRAFRRERNPRAVIFD